jgi:hypothetical protein
MHPTRLAVLLLGAAFVLSCGPDQSVPAQCASRLPGDLVITEFLPDPQGVDDGQEFIELYNASGAELELLGMTLSITAEDGSGERQHRFRSVKLAQGAYFAAGDYRSEPLPAWLNYSYGTDFGRGLRNTGGKISVRCGDKLIDEVTYGTVKAGRSRELNGKFTPDSTLNDVADNFCDGTESYDGVNLGTPGRANSTCETPIIPVDGTCQDPVTGQARQIVRPAVGDLVITEVMPNPDKVDDTKGEWFELTALTTVDLNELTVRTASSSSTVFSSICLPLAAGAFAILARSGDPALNGGLPAVTALFTVTLVNSNGRLSIHSGETLLDEVTWTTAPVGASLQLDPEKTDPVSNDDAANFCVSKEPYGAGDLGSPGAANVTCAPPVTDQTCFDADLGAARPVVRPGPGELVITEFMADPATPVTDANGEWFEVLATLDVDLNGLQLANEGTGSSLVVSTECLRIEAGQYALFARSADPALNGNLPAPNALFSFGLANTGARALVLRSGDVEIDRVTWTSSVAGASWQLSPDALDAVSNDDPANFCLGTELYSEGNRGTPGAPNHDCP